MDGNNAYGPFFRYSDEDKARLKELFYKYVPVGVIAKRLGRSKGSVRQAIHRMKLRRHASVSQLLQWTPPHLQLEHLEPMGVENWVRAAKAWRVDQLSKIKEAYHAAQLSPLIQLADEILPRTDLTRNAKMCLLREAGMKLQELAVIFDITRERVRQITDPNWYNAYKKKYEEAHPRKQRGRPRKDQRPER